MRIRISELEPHFAIRTKTIHKILLAYGEFLGEQLFEGAEGFETIAKDSFDAIVECCKEFWFSAYERDKVVAKASLSIPFDSVCRIYFLLKDREIVYIGQTEGIAQRIGAHCLDKQFNKVATFREDKDSINKIEQINIVRHHPKYNKGVPGGEWVLKQVLKEL